MEVVLPYIFLPSETFYTKLEKNTITAVLHTYFIVNGTGETNTGEKIREPDQAIFFCVAYSG